MKRNLPGACGKFPNSADHVVMVTLCQGRGLGPKQLRHPCILEQIYLFVDKINLWYEEPLSQASWLCRADDQLMRRN